MIRNAIAGFRPRVSTILLLILFAIACGALAIKIVDTVRLNLARTDILGSATPMTAEVHLKKAHSCTSLSPPIQVGAIPPGTEALAVQLTDLNYIFEHGGGTIPAPDNGLIPEGALTSYFGPCPDAGEVHLYRLRVNALDEDGKIVGLAETSLPCCSGLRSD